MIRYIFLSRLKQYLLIFLIFPALLIFLLCSSCSLPPRYNLDTATFRALTKIQKQKMNLVTAYFKKIRSKALEVGNDHKMLTFYFTLKKNKQSASEQNILEWEVNKYYIDKYREFYDILFVDVNGYVFYSLRKESDYRKNLFSDEFKETKLSQQLRQNSVSSLVDYDYYLPSDEAAAFFIVPVINGGKHEGWFVFQCAINKINTILTDYKNLGRTGEVYLVNKDKLMLSDSRFIEDSTILKQEVETRAIKEALIKKEGSRLIKDYRGVMVYSSYRLFECFGTTWVMIVEIDESEILTEYYKQHEKFYRKKICSFLEKRTPLAGKRDFEKRRIKRIDMNEVYKAGPGEILTTYGVSSCTGIIISYPGRFSYIGHIAPTDSVYLNNALAGFLLGSAGTDLLHDSLRRIMHYNVYPYELKKMRFFIVAVHNDSLKSIVKNLIDQGIMVDQIYFIYNPEADYANVFFDSTEEEMQVEWIYNEMSKNYIEDVLSLPDLGEVIKKNPVK